MMNKLTNLRNRDKIIRAIRTFFYSQGFTETETPCLVHSPGMEPHLQAFETRFIPEFSGESENLYLPTSPEFHMKRLVASGMFPIFQISRAFRNGETGQLHNPEFTILEWYRAYCGYEQIMKDIESLVCCACQAVNNASLMNYHGKTLDLSPPWDRMTVREAWIKFAGIDLKEMISPEALMKQGQQIGVPYLLPQDDWDVLYFKIFFNRIEPNLGVTRPLILYEYPARMAALSRIKPEDPSVSLRFEVYIAGIELANAFDELIDPDTQLARFHDAQKIKQTMGQKPFPVDSLFIEALQKGMPPCAGIAMGVDRLIMLLLNASSIAEVIAFPYPDRSFSE